MTHLNLPPPIPGVHLAPHPSLPLWILKQLLRRKGHLATEQRVGNELANTFNRVSVPQLQLLNHLYPIIALQISGNLQELRLPNRPLRQAVNCLVQPVLRLERWVGSIFDLNGVSPSSHA